MGVLIFIKDHCIIEKAYSDIMRNNGIKEDCPFKINGDETLYKFHKGDIYRLVENEWIIQGYTFNIIEKIMAREVSTDTSRSI